MSKIYEHLRLNSIYRSNYINGVGVSGENLKKLRKNQKELIKAAESLINGFKYDPWGENIVVQVQEHLGNIGEAAKPRYTMYGDRVL